jgi:TP53 regulating kinase-like protein
MEFIDGSSVKDILRQTDDCSLATQIGEGIAKMHDMNVIHGDLTTSNMISKTGDGIYWIDFGLSCQSSNVEDKAVDLYVLERGNWPNF